jgi:endoglucanase
MLIAEDGEGIYRFETVGGLDVRQLVGKAVLVGKNKTPGVIGARPIHLTTPEERQRKIPLDQLCIDIGPGGKAKIGERATFATRFKRVGPSIFAKAIDNRVGCAILVELLKNAPAHLDLCLSFSVQEEIGLRGAKVAANYFKPDLAFAIDSTPANDLPHYADEENIFYNTRLGFGPALYTFDSGTLNDPRLVRFLAETGDSEKIPYQYRQPGGGGTDAGAIHRQQAGIPAVSVSVPGRYAHTSTLVMRVEDWKNSLALLSATLKRITPDLLAEDRP